MLLLGHAGITLGLTKGLEKYLSCRGMKNFSRLIDYRLVFLGSLLPDIIDKPLGGLVFAEKLGNGRIYSHTLLFLFCLIIAGTFAWFKYRRPGLFVLAGGSTIHCILDGMWRSPETFLWPVNGWNFPKGDPENWLRLWAELLTYPEYYIPEILGGTIILIYFTSWLRERLTLFHRKRESKNCIT